MLVEELWEHVVRDICQSMSTTRISGLPGCYFGNRAPTGFAPQIPAAMGPCHGAHGGTKQDGLWADCAGANSALHLGICLPESSINFCKSFIKFNKACNNDGLLDEHWASSESLNILARKSSVPLEVKRWKKAIDKKLKGQKLDTEVLDKFLLFVSLIFQLEMIGQSLNETQSKAETRPWRKTKQENLPVSCINEDSTWYLHSSCGVDYQDLAEHICTTSSLGWIFAVKAFLHSWGEWSHYQRHCSVLPQIIDLMHLTETTQLRPLNDRKCRFENGLNVVQNLRHCSLSGETSNGTTRFLLPTFAFERS